MQRVDEKQQQFLGVAVLSSLKLSYGNDGGVERVCVQRYVAARRVPELLDDVVELNSDRPTAGARRLSGGRCCGAQVLGELGHVGQALNDDVDEAALRRGTSKQV